MVRCFFYCGVQGSYLMSIIIQTGHNSSFSAVVMDKLYQRGLNRPLVLHGKNQSVEQLAASLEKLFTRKNNFSQKIADNLVMDFLLANHEQQDWGWHDEKNLSALPYWQDLDDDIRFILVFDHPKYLVERLLVEELSKETLNAIVEEWVDYHTQLLAFYESFSDKCILIEGVAVIEKFSNLREKIESFNHSIEWKSSWQINTNEEVQANHDFISTVIIEEVLKHYPQVITLYNSLLSKATVKVSSNIYKTKKIELTDLVLALNELKINREFDVEKLLEESGLLSTTQLKLEQVQTESSNKITQIENKSRELEKENKKLSSQLTQLESNLKQVNVAKQAQTRDTELMKENELLITQLHQVQEELERYYLENQRLKSDKSSNGSKKPVYYGAAERVKNDLPYRLGAIMVKSKTPKEIVQLPVALVKEYRNFQHHKPNENLPPVEEYQDAYEANKVKKHLSYKFGKRIIEDSKTVRGVFQLFLALTKEYRDFKKS